MASQTTPLRTWSRDMAPSLGGWQPRSPGAPGAGVPQLAGDVLDRLAGRLDVGVGRHLEAAGVDEHPAADRLGAVAGDVLLDADPRVALGHQCEVLVDGSHPPATPDRVQVGKLPGTSGTQGDSPAAGAAQLTSD